MLLLASNGKAHDNQTRLCRARGSGEDRGRDDVVKHDFAEMRVVHYHIVLAACFAGQRPAHMHLGRQADDGAAHLVLLERLDRREDVAGVARRQARNNEDDLSTAVLWYMAS